MPTGLVSTVAHPASAAKQIIVKRIVDPSFFAR